MNRYMLIWAVTMTILMALLICSKIGLLYSRLGAEGSHELPEVCGSVQKEVDDWDRIGHSSINWR